MVLRREGFLAGVVESWIPHTNLRRDLFGFADVLAAHPQDCVFLLVQVTTADHVAHRLAKARARPELAIWLKAGGRFEVHGWRQRKGRWFLRRVEAKGKDLEITVLSAPPRRRRLKRGERGLAL
jgi:hypothetical protein